MNTAITAQQLQQLDQIIDSAPFKNKILTIEQIHGFFCALISSPVTLTINNWLPTIYGNDKSLMNHVAAKEFNMLVKQLFDSVVESFKQGSIKPLIFVDQQSIDYQAAGNEQLFSWCAGYMTGVALNKKAWFASGHNEIYEILTPISAFAQFFDGHKPHDKNLQAFEPQQIREQYLPQLADAISTAFFFWRQHQHCHHGHGHHQNNAIAHHTAAKVGRNDPCHCGSGKKYKKCCAA